MLVALAVVAIGLTALMVAVSGTARTSGYLRDKTIAQWIALNRLTQVRLQVNKLGDTQDTGEIEFAGQKWHYDTRYFDTQFQSMKRVVVRVYPGDAKTKGNPIAESTGFLGSSLGIPGSSNVDWTVGSTLSSAPCVGPTSPSALGGNVVRRREPAARRCAEHELHPGLGQRRDGPRHYPRRSDDTTPQGQTTP